MPDTTMGVGLTRPAKIYDKQLDEVRHVCSCNCFPSPFSCRCCYEFDCKRPAASVAARARAQGNRPCLRGLRRRRSRFLI